VMDRDHRDYAELSKVVDGFFDLIGGRERLEIELPRLVKNAVDFVLDPARTSRTKIDELDKVEKTFIGLKIEHFIRDWLGAPKGVRRDLKIGEIDVDIKHTIGTTWMIPPETYKSEEPCLLIATAKFDGKCSLGFLLARDAYLTKPNRDQKRGLSSEGQKQIWWLVKDRPFPRSRWDGIDMDGFRRLRASAGGTNRAANFFRQNLGRKVDRSIIQALLYDQLDYMKRVRGNGGARDRLREDGIILLWGKRRADLERARTVGIFLEPDEFVAIKGR
jgi:hypothetical protein